MIVIVNENTQEQWVGNWNEFVRDNIESIPWETLTEIHDMAPHRELHMTRSGWTIRKVATFPLYSVGHTLVDNGMAYGTSFPPKEFDELMSFHVSNIDWDSGDDFNEIWLSAEDKATIKKVSESKLSKATALYIQERGRQANEEWR